jgi:hypothetical protein
MIYTQGNGIETTVSSIILSSIWNNASERHIGHASSGMGHSEAL